jgi:lysyl-tRNA synthetase, class II
MSRLDETIQAKIEKRTTLEEKGVKIHPHSFDKKDSIAKAKDSKDKVVQTAGRIMSKREHGRVIFFDVQDSTDSMQAMFREQQIGKEAFKNLRYVDPGDFIGVTGKVDVTRTGEITILVDEYTFLGKSLRPLPTSWNAAEDKEARFRKRYLDMLVSPRVKEVLDARWLIEKELRRYMQDKHDFVEVETPIFQPLYGGTNATPFTTYMNALDTDYYLRIAPELYLKRLIVGGYEKVFEIARNFRNEGIDQTHQPEFTMIEWYEAYADYHKMMDVTEGLIRHLVEKVNGNTEIVVGDHTVDVGKDWPRITMIDAMKKHLDLDFESLKDEEIQKVLDEKNIEITGEFTRGKAQFALFDKLVPEFLIKPTWIIDYPRDVSPLAKSHRLNSDLAERFEGYAGGKEIADGWSEIVDPVDQRNIFDNEQKRMRAGDDEAHPLDEDFLEAMEYGMPPLGGIGMGIDRLVMLITNTWSIKEVIAFPTLKPLNPVKAITRASRKDNKPEDNKELPPRKEAEDLVKKYIKNDKLTHHCKMVAIAMSAYAKELGEDEELWYQTGLLHDLDWEMYPDDHPNKAVNEILTNYPRVVLEAIEAHAPGITGKQPSTVMEKYLFACDELSGLMHAVSLMRPNGFEDMKSKSVKKKIKDKSFAANVSRDDIKMGFELIGKAPDEHISFLIEVFKKEE